MNVISCVMWCHVFVMCHLIVIVTVGCSRNKKYEIRKCRLLTNSKMNMQVMIYRYVCVITNCYWCSSLYICVSIHAISNLCLNHVRICLPPAASTPIAKNRTWQNAYHWKKHQVKNHPHSLSVHWYDNLWLRECTRHQAPVTSVLPASFFVQDTSSDTSISWISSWDNRCICQKLRTRLDCESSTYKPS